jgi:hypothetical protein
MTDDDRDPTLQALFAEAEKDLAGEAFTGQTMARIDNLKRRTSLAWIGAGLLLVLCTWLLAAPLQDAALLLTESLSLPVVDLDHRWLAQVLSPLNSIGSLLALALLTLRSAHRRLFS